MTTEDTTVDTATQLIADSEGFKAATRRGIIAAVALAVLSVIEFLIAEALTNPLWPIMPFVLLKGWVILDTFMHVKAVFRTDGDH